MAGRMTKHIFAKLIIWAIIISLALWYFAPATFNSLKNTVYEKLKINPQQPLLPQAGGSETQNQNIVQNNTQVPQIQYNNLGKITTERACTSDLDCNTNLTLCSNNCTCKDGFCYKLV